jgi:hypothetical protein
MMDMLARQFPEAGLVHLYRDGRECVMSMGRHDGFKLMAFSRLPELAPAGMRVGDLLDREAVARAVVPPDSAAGSGRT